MGSIHNLSFVRRYQQRSEHTMALNTTQVRNEVTITAQPPTRPTYMPCRRSLGDANLSVQEYHRNVMGELDERYQDQARAIKKPQATAAEQ